MGVISIILGGIALIVIILVLSKFLPNIGNLKLPNFVSQSNTVLKNAGTSSHPELSNFDKFNVNVAGVVGGLDSAKNAQTNILTAKFDEFQKQKQLRTAVELGFTDFESLPQSIKDSNSILLDPRDDGSIKFNPPNTVGFGIKTINNGLGLSDTSENRMLILAGQKKIGRRRGRFG